MNPVEIDTLFNETIHKLKVSPSERVKLKLVFEFLDVIEGKEEKYQSYLIQIVDRLPKLENPLLYAGLNPSYFESFLNKLKNASSKIIEIQKNQSFIEIIDSYNLALNQLYSWVGIVKSSEQITTGLIQANSRRLFSKTGEILIPVVEEFAGSYIGRLRKLYLDILGIAQNSHQIKPTFGIVGAEIENFTKPAEQAVDRLVVDSIGNINRKWKATIHFELPHTWHSGNSANLAIAGAFYSQILKEEEQQERFWINPAACITGDLDDEGNVLSVSANTLDHKVEAAFFSWVHVIVVPINQLTHVTSKVEELMSRYPNRVLQVIGIKHLRELFFDRRITIYNKTSYLNHHFKKLWKRKSKVAVIIFTVISLLTIARLSFGPIDRNITQFNVEGTEFVFLNSKGDEIRRLNLPPSNANSSVFRSWSSQYDIVHFVDYDNNGSNEIIIGSTDNRQNGYLTFFESNLIDTIWHKKLEYDIPFSKHPDALNTSYRPIRIKTHDLDDDGELELIATLQQKEYFKSLLVTINLETEEDLDTLVNAGWLDQILVNDVDSDTQNDIIVCGLFKGFDMPGCFIIDHRNMSGHYIMHSRYLDDGMSQANIKMAFLIPKSILGKKMDEIIEGFDHYGNVISLLYEPTDRVYTLNIFDSAVSNEEEGDFISLYYKFDQNFKPISVGSSDSYDRYANEYYENGLVNILHDPLYISTFKDSLYWWDGQNWVQKFQPFITD
jgi:hypothetical protein